MVENCHIEKILSKLGNPGRYQLLFYVLCIGAIQLIVFNYGIITSLNGISTKHRCYPSEDYITYFSDKTNQNITLEDLQLDQCSVSLKRNKSRYNATNIIPCHKWLYEKIEGRTVDTIVTKWDLVCKKNFYPMLANTLFFVGVLIGSVITGHLSDQYGRRPVLLVFTFLSCLLTCGSVLSPNVYVYIVVRFVAGMCLSGVHTAATVLTMEQTKAKHNYLINLVLMINFLGTVTVTAFLTWLIQVWWKVQLYLTIHNAVIFVISIFALPESYHWLAVHKKKEELDKQLAFAAKFNGVEPPDTDFLLDCNKELENPMAEIKERKAYSITTIFINFREIRKRLIFISTTMCLCTLSYYIMTLNARELSDNPYKVIMISAAFDAVPLVAIYPILKRFGKRKLFMACFGFSGVMCIVYKCYNHIALMIVGKMFIGTGMGVLFFYSCDIFPTVIRNVCMGFGVLMGRFGGIIAPQIVLLGRYSARDHPVLFSGITLLLATLFTYFLPDMKNKPFPKTIEEVENCKNTSDKEMILCMEG